MNNGNFKETIDLVKEFYDHAWNSLLMVVGIVFGIFGVILPLIITITQIKSNYSSMKKLEKEYEKQKKAIGSMATESRIAMGSIYFQQGNLQALEHETYGAKTNIDPLNIYLSYLKSLNCFLDTSNMKYIDASFDQLTQTSNRFSFSKTSKCYPELRDIYNQVIEKLEKNKDIELYSSIRFYLKNLFQTIENNNK
jgi:hypothetical protein